MRIAALILGIIGALVLWTLTFWTAALGSLAGSSSLLVVSYIIPIAALVGACLALKYPTVACGLLLGAAALFLMMIGVGPVSLGLSALVIIAGVLAFFGRGELSGGTPMQSPRTEPRVAVPAPQDTGGDMGEVRPSAADYAASTFGALKTWFSALSPRARWLGVSGAAALFILLPLVTFLSVDSARYCKSTLARLGDGSTPLMEDLGVAGQRFQALFSPSRAASAAMFSDPLRAFPIKVKQRVIIFDPITVTARMHFETYDAASGATQAVIIDGKGVATHLAGTIDANGAQFASADGKIRWTLHRQGNVLAGVTELAPGTVNEIELDLAVGLAAAHKQSPAGGCEDESKQEPVVVELPKGAAAIAAAGAIDEAPYQIVDRGMCPGEGCEYGGEWRAKQEVRAYATPADRIGADLTNAQSKTIAVGQWVKTVTGLILAKRIVGHVQRAAPASPYSPALAEGQPVALYSSLGEGCLRSWINGMFGVVCDAEATGDAKDEWWVEVQLADGSTAWTSEVARFVSRDSLNDQLGQTIARAETALPERLKEVDAQMKQGAQLNGSAGKYGTDPAQAAFSSNNVELVKALVQKGLAIDGAERCPAASAAWTALRPNGNVMLEYLLANGLKLDCLQLPPLHAFLQPGIATADYPADRAIVIAKILVAHGADVAARDGQGKSILDILDAGNAERVAPLRQMLNEAVREFQVDALNTIVAGVEPQGANPPEQTAGAARLGVGGQWDGNVTYDNGTPGFIFTMTINAAGTAITGRSQEPNTFGRRGVPHLYANIHGTVLGDGSIAWVKTYDGSGGVSHSVAYKGTVDMQRNTMSGTWTTQGVRGGFTLRRR